MRYINDYNQYYETILEQGYEQAPRGSPTKALMDVAAPWRVGWMPRRRGDNPAIGIIEGLQLIAGVFDFEAIAAAAPGAKLDLFGHQSAYGPRIVGQVQWVIDLLREDPQTRRAQITLPNKGEDPDMVPCTSLFQFQMYGGTLNTSVYMRSSDATWGMPYDLIQFSMLAKCVASCLGVEAEFITTHLGNAHVYDMNRFDGVWYNDYLVLPRFSSLSNWRSWALEIIGGYHSGHALRSMFLESQMAPEYAYTLSGGGLS